jgi:general secretion pathway protein J
VQVVAYRISNGALSRRESVATRDLTEIDVAWAAAMSDAATAPAVTLHSAVSEMNLRTYVENGGWRAAAAGTAPPPPPVTPGGTVEAITGLEVTLRLRDGANLVKIFLRGAA